MIAFRRTLLSSAVCLLGLHSLASNSAEAAAPPPPDDETPLGEMVVTGVVKEKLLRVAILPSFSSSPADVDVRATVRHDLELTDSFDIIDDSKAPPGNYGFNDEVDIAAWKTLGAEVILKLAAVDEKIDDKPTGKIKIRGLAYFPQYGSKPVYEKVHTVSKAGVRLTAHHITDALLGAVTGNPGSFASRLTFGSRIGKTQTVFTMESDGHNLTLQTDMDNVAIGPNWGPDGNLFYSQSIQYSPFRLYRHGSPEPVRLPFAGSIYSVAYNHENTKIAVAVSENAGSAIYVGKPDGTSMVRVSKTELATHPTFSPEGKLAWIGGSDNGTQRVYLDGKTASPSGFTAAAPTFCETRDGTYLIYSVHVAGGRQDLIMGTLGGGVAARLTQNEGSNTYPACSPDGRLLAYFSDRKTGEGPGLYVKSVHRWKTHRLSGRQGLSLRWAMYPEDFSDSTNSTGNHTPEQAPPSLGCGRGQKQTK